MVQMKSEGWYEFYCLNLSFKVLQLAKEWVEKYRPENSTLHIKEVENRTPIMLLEIPGDRDGNILMYGHLDKQPEMEGWNDELGPWKPVMKDEKLYGKWVWL